MESMLTFTGIIIIVFGILQIILFFKLWRMTNDVRKIKSELCSEKDINEATVLYLKGEKRQHSQSCIMLFCTRSQ